MLIDRDDLEGAREEAVRRLARFVGIGWWELGEIDDIIRELIRRGYVVRPRTMY